MLEKRDEEAPEFATDVVLWVNSDTILLTGNKCGNWLHLVERLMQVNLTDEQDVFVWRLTSSGMFTVKSNVFH